MSVVSETDNQQNDENENGIEDPGLSLNNVRSNVISSPIRFDVADDDENLIELVVLDPDHVLMQRFQRALNDSLTKQFERVQLENRETTEDLKKHKDQHLEAGNELFTVQRELAKFQSNLDGLMEEYNNALASREDVEQNLRVAKNDYVNVKKEVEKETEKMMILRKEMDNIGLRLFYLRSAKEDIVGDIAVMKRAAEKAVEDLTKAENEKMQQDYILDGLVSEVGRLKEDITLYDAQLIAQSDEHCAAKQTLHEAQDEIQSIILERKQLMTKWNSSLIHLTRRNEVYHSLNESLNEKKEQILVLENEIEGYKRNTRKEGDLNERLTLLFKKNEVDLAFLNKNIADCQMKYQNIKVAYADNLIVLQETERILSNIYKEKKEESLLTGNIHEELERLSMLKHYLEDNITEEIRNKLALKSAAHYTDKITKKARDNSRHVESELVLMYNLLSTNSLKVAELQTDVSEIQKYIDIMEKEITKKNETINKLETELGRSKTTIERKQVCIDKLNKQYEALLSVRGGVELGPLEITISHLNRNIHMTYEEIRNLEQQWLKEQNIIVRLLTEKSDLNNNILRVKQQLSLLRQKQIRIEGFIQQENNERSDIEKELTRIQNDLVKVNRLMHKEKNSKEALEKINILAETDFIRALKEEELDCIQLQSKINDAKEEMDRMLKDVVETQWQVMMYEKKIQMIQESQLTMKSDLGQGEITSMRQEIHRMEVRHKQLKQQQELLIQDMEKSVMKFVRFTEALEKMSNKVVTKGATERQIAQVKRRIDETKENIGACEKRIVSLEREIIELRDKLIQQKTANSTAQNEVNNVSTVLNELADAKYAQVMKLQYHQQLYKHYTELKDRKYVRLCKTNAAIEKEKTIQRERIQSLLLIVDRISAENPQTLGSLNCVRQGIHVTMGENPE